MSLLTYYAARAWGDFLAGMVVRVPRHVASEAVRLAQHTAKVYWSTWVDWTPEDRT